MAQFTDDRIDWEITKKNNRRLVFRNLHWGTLALYIFGLMIANALIKNLKEKFRGQLET